MHSGRQADAADKIGEARIGAQRSKHRIDLQINEPTGAILEALFQPLKSLVLVSQRASQTYVQPIWIAVIHAALGDKEGAIALLQEAFEKSDLYLIVSRTLREMAPLLADPRARRIFDQVDALRRTQV